MRRQFRPKRRQILTVATLSSRARRGTLAVGSLRFPCALGRTGSRVLKREGDGATPIGRWALREALYRPDRGMRPRTALPARAIGERDGWCDCPGDRNYNRRVHLPYPASAERLYREDGLYDVIVVLAYNDRPRMRDRGSAIFMHVARPGYAPTEGCIALARTHLLRVLAHVRAPASIRVGGA